MDHVGASELLGVYVLDACDEAEAAEVRAHVVACEGCAHVRVQVRLVQALAAAGHFAGCVLGG